MRMRQSMAELERAFEHDAAVDRQRGQQLRRNARERTRVRRRARIEQSQRARFIVLLLSIALTAVVVTVVMFETLAWLIG